jgi:hypothetical protein
MRQDAVGSSRWSGRRLEFDVEAHETVDALPGVSIEVPVGELTP